MLSRLIFGGVLASTAILAAWFACRARLLARKSRGQTIICRTTAAEDGGLTPAFREPADGRTAGRRVMTCDLDSVAVGTGVDITDHSVQGPAGGYPATHVEGSGFGSSDGSSNLPASTTLPLLWNHDRHALLEVTDAKLISPQFPAADPRGPTVGICETCGWRPHVARPCYLCGHDTRHDPNTWQSWQRSSEMLYSCNDCQRPSSQ